MTARNADPPLRVMIVDDETLVGLGLRTQLQKMGHSVVGQAANATEAKEMFREEQPDLVLMDIRLNGTDGIELAQQLLAERRCPMIIVSAYSDRELIDRAASAGVFGYLIKPIGENSLAAQIEIAVTRFDEREQVLREKEKIAQDLQTRRLLDRAKAILIKRAGLTEDEAHRRLQQESQKKRIPLAELCQKILDADDLIGR